MLSLYNTLTRKKVEFKPADAKNVRMYVCGPTVYDRPHLGNARSVVVYDVLYRLLRHIYGEKHVTYVRNITDVDDKINAAAKANNEPISALTKRVESWFHEDMAALNCLRPNIEPHATDHIKEMITIIEKLLAGGHAYESEGHVLFRVESYKEYGKLSGRKLEDLIAGARVEVESYKENSGDFVLWKPADEGDDPSSVFDSPWGAGRPGWHIECSAMSSKYLGDDFDIHGGGADLMFPHHENEIAQSCCAAPNSHFATTWVHNGFLTVNGEKMSKSLGNFVTMRQFLADYTKASGQIARLCFLSTHYRNPLNWTAELVNNQISVMERFYYALKNSIESNENKFYNECMDLQPDIEFINTLADDLNTSDAINYLHELTTITNKEKDPRSKALLGGRLKACGKLIGLFHEQISRDDGTSLEEYIHSSLWFGTDHGWSKELEEIKDLINERIAAKKSKNWARADEIRKTLAEQGIILEDRPDGSTDWRRE